VQVSASSVRRRRAGGCHGVTVQPVGAGLLQTEQYARAILAVNPGVTEDQVSERLAAQLAHLGGVARLPNITIQVVPSIAHAGLLGGFAVAERAAYVETAVAGQVFEDADIMAGLLTRFDTLRNEAFRGSESLTLIERIYQEWTATGARAATRVTTAGNA